MDKKINEKKGNHRLYFPSEGFGAIYRRFMLNEFFEKLTSQRELRRIAEIPCDSYGAIGAGSLIFNLLNCEVSIVHDDPFILEKAKLLWDSLDFVNLQIVKSDLYKLPFPENHFDLSWNFDRIQALTNPSQFLQEMSRVSKMVLVIVPNAHNYGQYLHHVYHMLNKSDCDFVGPRAWMKIKQVRKVLIEAGMEVMDEGPIDVPWWPGFPELPNLVRQFFGKKQVKVAGDTPEPLSSYEWEQTRKKVEKATFIERSRLPMPLKIFFAHNCYIIAKKRDTK